MNTARKRSRVLCIDNHSSSNYVVFLLARSGYSVSGATFLSDALELTRSASFDLFLVNDDMVRGLDKPFVSKLREAAGATPVMFYSNIIYPYSPRSADQSGRTPDTAVPATEVVVAVDRLFANESMRPLVGVHAA